MVQSKKEKHMRKVSADELNFNAFDKIANEWMLVAAGTKENGYNAMTASWGHIGSLWGNGGGLPTAIIFLRPQRYTKEFVDQEGYFTLSFFPKDKRKALSYMGSHSGRDEDKAKNAGLTPAFDEKTVWFEEASLVLKCRKLYHSTIEEKGFVDKSLIDTMYPGKDYHEMYIGEIVEILKA